MTERLDTEVSQYIKTKHMNYIMPTLPITMYLRLNNIFKNRVQKYSIEIQNCFRYINSLNNNNIIVY